MVSTIPNFFAMSYLLIRSKESSRSVIRAEATMELLDFAVEVIGVSASGVLAPGPLFFANLLYGARLGPKSGLKMACGHTIVELPLIILLAAGVFTSSLFMGSNAAIVGIIGGAGILTLAGIQIVELARTKANTARIILGKRGPLVAGIALSALNPFFIIWWLTAGLKLVADSASFGTIAGISLLFGLHIWMDFVWLIASAYLSSRGGSALNSKYYFVLLLCLTGVLVYFGLRFIFDSLS